MTWLLLVCTFQSCVLVDTFATFEGCEKALNVVAFPVYATCTPSEGQPATSMLSA